MTDLDSAYGLESPDDNLKLYSNWARTYDSDFAQDMDYVLPYRVAEAFKAAGGTCPVLDMGAGTGLCGLALRGLAFDTVDATDLSNEMLEVARGKEIYRALFPGNLLERLPIDDGTYAGAVSSGTFTHGHVGPKALTEVLRVVKPGGVIALSINVEHWMSNDYDAAFAALGNAITDLNWTETRIYGEKAQGKHADDLSRIVTFRKA